MDDDLAAIQVSNGEVSWWKASRLFRIRQRLVGSTVLQHLVGETREGPFERLAARRFARLPL